ncbi:MAG: nucleoside-diphosphate kinase, partial [Bacteroidales bacterium]
MEQTLLLIKPSAIQRGLIGEVITRIEKKGLKLTGMKMMNLDDAIINEHYSHLVQKPFFPIIKSSMQATPVIACCIEGIEAVQVVRALTGSTNGRNALPGTIRGDFSVSVLENIVHTSDSIENAKIEVKRFFCDNEIFSYKSA